MFNPVSEASVGGVRVEELQRTPLPSASRQAQAAERIDEDVVEISEAARRREIETGREASRERVARIRGEIAGGTYETPEKLEIAVERLHRALTGR